MKSVYFKLIICLLATLASACSQVVREEEQVRSYDTVITATGSRPVITSPGLTMKQQQLTAEQAAKMQAYRKLAELLYQNIAQTHGSQIIEKIIEHEPYRVYFDMYLRSAKIIGRQSVDQQISVALRLDIDQQFDRCMLGDSNVIIQCIQQFDKLAFSRLGYNQATAKVVNLTCLQTDCSDLQIVGGFGHSNNDVDKILLQAGLYDSEWLVNMAGRLWVNFFIFDASLQ